jgi:hypothetical protein
MPVISKEKPEIAQKLMDDFAFRTGLSGNRGNIKKGICGQMLLLCRPFLPLPTFLAPAIANFCQRIF